MKIEESVEELNTFTKSTSDVARQFAFAGIAIIWIFKIDKPVDHALLPVPSLSPTGHLLPVELLRPLWWLIITLGCDLLQYFIPSIIWGIFYLYYRKKLKPEENKETKGLIIPGILLYFGKIGCLIYSYYLIFQFISPKI